MNRQVVKTNDNSSTLFVPELDQHYHSTHGAVQESMHVFIEAGLLQFMGATEPIHILEIGFGTGLNPLLTLMDAEKNNLQILFTTLEKYPLNMAEVLELNYGELLGGKKIMRYLTELHQVVWEKWIEITPNFSILKKEIDFKSFSASAEYNLIYFDAFAPSAQPNLWTIDIFKSMFKSLKPGGILVTYCSKGDVRRNMMAAGFEIEKIPGPPRKREMVRARKGSKE